MSDPTEYDPNSKDLTDDADFPPPKCGVCGVPWADHMGIMGVCLWNKALREDLVNLGKDNAQLYKERDQAIRERDAARVEVCDMTPRYEGRHDDTFEESKGVAVERGWDCYKEKTQ